MPSAFSDLIRYLLGSRGGTLPSSEPFPPLDLDQIARQLDITQKGEDDGRNNLPLADGRAESVTERAILTEIENRAKNERNRYQDQLDLYDRRIRSSKISANQGAAIQAAGQSALKDFKVQALDDRNHLHRTALELKERQKELDDFKNKHGLARMPRVVSQRERVIRGLLLTLFVLAESVLNGLFFAEGSQAGIIGGVAEAFSLALLNIGGAVIYALYGLPLLRHSRSSLRIVGLVTTAVYCGLAIGVNLFIGHYRDAFAAMGSEMQIPATEVLRAMIAEPLGFATARSFVLFALGVLLNVLAVIDASGLTDPYLGYGSTGRRRDDAAAAYADLKASCMAGLTRRRDEGVKEMLRVVSLLQDQATESRLAMTGRRRFDRSYRDYHRTLATGYSDLVQRYREANIRTRTTHPPERFSEEPVPPAMLAGPPPLGDLPDATDLVEGEIALVETLIQKLNDQFEEAVGGFKTVEALTDRSE